MRRLFADRLVLATGAAVILISALFALSRVGMIAEVEYRDALSPSSIA